MFKMQKVVPPTSSRDELAVGLTHCRLVVDMVLQQEAALDEEMEGGGLRRGLKKSPKAPKIWIPSTYLVPESRAGVTEMECCGDTCWPIVGVTLECCDETTNAAGPACCGPHPWAGSASHGSICCDGNYLFEELKECPESCGTDKFMICALHDNKDFHEECKKYKDIKDLRVGDDLGGKKKLAGFGCCEDNPFARNFVAFEGAKVGGKEGENICLHGVSRGTSLINETYMDLFAKLNETSCAELLPFGPRYSYHALTGGNENSWEFSKDPESAVAFFCTDCIPEEIKSNTWLQIVYHDRPSISDTLHEVLRIVWNFEEAKTMKERFMNAFQNGENVKWHIIETTDEGAKNEVDVVGKWYFSENFKYDNAYPANTPYRKPGWPFTDSGDGSAPGYGFSPDDGMWGAGSCVDGSSGVNENFKDPISVCQVYHNDMTTTIKDFWGVANVNWYDNDRPDGSDTKPRCGFIYHNGTKESPDPARVKVEMYANRWYYGPNV